VTCSVENEVKIIGTVTDSLIAGRLEICYDSIWRAVYDTSWSTHDVQLVCQEKGFPVEGEPRVGLTMCTSTDTFVYNSIMLAPIHIVLEALSRAVCTV
jgi:hypothetical protein